MKEEKDIHNAQVYWSRENWFEGGNWKERGRERERKKKYGKIPLKADHRCLES